MSHLPLSLMNRLNKTESAVFKLWMLYFQRISFQIIFKELIFFWFQFCGILGGALVPLTYMSTWLLCHSVTAALFASSFVLFGKFCIYQNGQRTNSDGMLHSAQKCLCWGGKLLVLWSEICYN